MVRQHHPRHLRLSQALLAGALVLAGALPLRAATAGLPVPLTDQPGDARRGKAVAVNSDKGNCIICHVLPIPEVPAGAFGDIGPPLAGVASRLSPAEIRLRLVDAREINPDTVMPPYHALTGLTRVDPGYARKPILEAQDIEDLQAYLETLK